MKVAVAGLTHGHVWGLIEDFAKLPGSELVAVADATPLLEKAKERFARSYTNWREMLAQETIDALIVTSDNVESAEIAVVALEKGIPTLVEKAMAANLPDAERMLAAQAKGNAPLIINWPFAWDPVTNGLKDLLASGEIGKVFHLRFRNGHFGPKEIGCDEYFVGWLHDETKNGGGAIADFASYGAVLAVATFGLPDSVFCIRHNATKDYDISDDHAILLLKYDKLTVLLEGTWATFGMDSGSNLVIHGSEGTLALKERGVLEKTIRWGERSEVKFDALPYAGPAAFMEAVIQGKADVQGVLSPVHSADAVRILEAAKESSRTGCAVKL